MAGCRAKSDDRRAADRVALRHTGQGASWAEPMRLSNGKTPEVPCGVVGVVYYARGGGHVKEGNKDHAKRRQQ
jgi:hypothetical protein